MRSFSIFKDPLPDVFVYGDGPSGTFPAIPLVEQEMMRLSAEIRRKLSWWTKFRDPQILARWRSEALAQVQQMREPHVDYVLKELDRYAKLRDEENGVEVSCYDMIWQSDRLIPAPLRERLLAGVAELEDVPESKKDWHPRSNGQVLDLVHPSLYPIVYGRTLSYPEDSRDRDTVKLELCLKPPVQPAPDWKPRWYNKDSYFISKRFQWLPTDFKVSDDGKSVKSDGYINNLHPIRHAELHKTIEDLVAAYIPLFERVLTDCIPTNRPVPCRTASTYSFDTEGQPAEPSIDDFPDRAEYNRKYWEWQQNLPIGPPKVRDYQPEPVGWRQDKYTLGGSTIQVIVKLANIHLTPDKPTYPGGSWHIEGMKNEAIAVSGIYYYDEENITESRLAFRTAVAQPDEYEQDNEDACMLTWGMARGDPCVNELGSVITSQHRCIAFPNVYQHRVSPFELADKSRPGHRKIVALFLVDPAVRRPSTKIVPPQQQDWHASGIASNPRLRAGFDKLPLEIINRIDSMAEGLMTREEAEQYRLELMDERTQFTEASDSEWFMAPFSMCEH